MLYSTLRKLSNLLLFLLCATASWAFDSSDAYNTITFSYVDNAFVKQTFVLSPTQQSSAQSFKLTVDAKDGGGRPTHNLDGSCASYCTQFDTARIEIIAYNSSGGVISTKGVDQNLKNWGGASNPGWSATPGDNLHPWSQMSVSITAADVGGSFSNVARIEVRLVNKNEGSYWAGNYGVQFRTPTLQTNGTGKNLLYNSEFGVDSTGIKVQGWQPSYSNYVNCGVTSGNSICTTQEAGVTANMWGGGEDPNGGTTNSQPGGYESVLTSDNADIAASGGDINSGAGGGTSTPPSTTPVYRNSAITSIQSTRKATNLLDTMGHKIQLSITGDSNDVYIQQIGLNGSFASVIIEGDSNNLEIIQTALPTARHYIEAAIIGYSNDLTLLQSDTSKIQFVTINGDGNSVTTNQKGSGNHFLDLTVLGNNHTAVVVQDGAGNHEARIVLEGSQPWNFTLNQSGSDNKKYTLPHDMSDGTIVTGVCAAIAGCTLTINQLD